MTACDDAPVAPATDADFFTAEEWESVKPLSPLPTLPADPTNRVADDPAAASLGQKLFFERRFHVIGLKIGTDAVHASQQSEAPVPDAAGPLGATGVLSCASCHPPSKWFGDARQTSLGPVWLSKQAPPIVNAAFYKYWGWNGSYDTMWGMGALYCEPTNFLGGTRVGAARVIYTHYKSEYEGIFGALPAPLASTTAGIAEHAKPRRNNEPLTPPVDGWVGAWNAMSIADRHAVNTVFVNIHKAIAAYERTLISRNAPWDRYIAGDFTAISPQAKRGAKLFVGKAACSACHSGPFFTDDKYHKTAVPTASSPRASTNDAGHLSAIQGFVDYTPAIRDPEVEKAGIGNWSAAGAGTYSDDKAAGIAKLQADGYLGAAPDYAAVTPDQAEHGKIRTKGLRQVAETGPYMRQGAFATLEQVVDFYNVPPVVEGIDPLMRPLNLDAAERSDLVEFLKTLTGEPIPSALTADTSVP